MPDDGDFETLDDAANRFLTQLHAYCLRGVVRPSVFFDVIDSETVDDDAIRIFFADETSAVVRIARDEDEDEGAIIPEDVIPENYGAIIELLDALATEDHCRCPVHPDGCPGGDCDGCPGCFSGSARRILTTLENENPTTTKETDPS
jgi:hypothetical protein